MAGVPVFTQDAYVSRLVRAGYRVVLCEQLEGYGAHGAARAPRGGVGNPASGGNTGIMRRAVTRVVTRGTILEEALLAPKAHNYVAAVSFVRPTAGTEVMAALAWADVSTGNADVRVCTARELPSLLAAVAPVELVVPVSVHDGQDADTVARSSGVEQLVRATRRSLGEGPDEQQFDAILRNMQAAARSWKHLQRRMSDPSVQLSTVELSCPLPQLQLPGLDTTENCQLVAWQADAFNAGSSTSPDLAPRTAALSGLDTYLRWTLRSAAPSLRASGPPSVRSQAELTSAVPLLTLDAATRRSLEIVRPMNGRRRARGCLLHAIDSCNTAMGSRLLDVRLCNPLADVQVIRARHDAVQFLVHHADLLRVLRARLGAIPDVERCFQRLQTGRGGMPDLIALRDALARSQWIGAMVLADDVVLFNNSKAVQLDAAATQKLTTLPTVRDAMLQAGRFFDSMPDGADRAAAATSLPHVLRDCAAVLVAPQSPEQLQSMMTAGAESQGMIHLQRLAIGVHELWRALDREQTQDRPPTGGVDTTPNPTSNERAIGAHFGQPTIRAGYAADLDEWRRLRDDGERSIAQLQDALRAATGIATIRVKRSEDKGIIVEVPSRSVAEVDRVMTTSAEAQPIGRKGDAKAAPDSEHTAPHADFYLRHVRTMKSATRYTCPASERLQADLLRAAAQVDALESQIVQRLQVLVTEAAPAITAILRSLAVLDVTATCAFNAVTFGMVRPVFVDAPGVEGANAHSGREPMLSIRAARHLVVERALLEGWHATSDDDLADVIEQTVVRSDSTNVQGVGSAESAAHPRAFVPNDVVLGAGDEASDADALWTPTEAVWRATRQAKTIILSGPNMGGKSTYLRQIAHCVLLAQMGSFVPAESARLSVVDKLFTRIGAADDLTRDRSTFLVEMEETAHILRNATSNSLVLVDEVGRGTASVDGLALAWSILEHLVNVVKCRTIFATHMHELTAAAVQLEHRKQESDPSNKTTLAERINPAIRCMTMLVNVTERGPILTHRIALHPLYTALLNTDRSDGDPWHNVINMSFGVHVARMAGVPAPVLERASAILQHLDASRAPAAWARAVAEIDSAMPRKTP